MQSSMEGQQDARPPDVQLAKDKARRAKKREQRKRAKQRKRDAAAAGSGHAASEDSTITACDSASVVEASQSIPDSVPSNREELDFSCIDWLVECYQQSIDRCPSDIESNQRALGLSLQGIEPSRRSSKECTRFVLGFAFKLAELDHVNAENEVLVACLKEMKDSGCMPEDSLRERNHRLRSLRSDLCRQGKLRCETFACWQRYNAVCTQYSADEQEVPDSEQQRLAAMRDELLNFFTEYEDAMASVRKSELWVKAMCAGANNVEVESVLQICQVVV